MMTNYKELKVWQKLYRLRVDMWTGGANIIIRGSGLSL